MPIFNNPPLKNYISDDIEIGYNQYGPTVALSGTLTALHKVVLIYDMILQCEQKKQTIKHHFHWLAFRPHTFHVGGFSGIDLKSASRFMITPANPYKYNILFSDHKRYSAINPIMNYLREQWIAKSRSASSDIKEKNSQDLFKKFLQSDEIKIAIRKLQDFSYWHIGEYGLKVTIITDKPKEKIEETKSFVLNKEDIATLNKNIFAILSDICGQRAEEYAFATTKMLNP